MDTGDLYKASSSLRAQSSSIWRDSAIQIFSQSSRDEDDEEALKWASLEKLPTFRRLKKGLLPGSTGVNEVDVANLGFEQRKVLIERLIKVAEEDNEKFLLKLRDRIDKLTLLLGPPSSGKTTLLLALAGKLDRDLKVSGRVTYNGHGLDEFVPQRTAAYISQHDLHIGEMTVRETFSFSARCQGVGSRYGE
ncbi:unnamed protein product [Ilex paraguariensis]|uniref:ABC transporter domain-containing protein n=1 Tax=Ilex paraguariensis TaxID=185542 RepID=A0ABC8TZN3_9AQUA